MNIKGLMKKGTKFIILMVAFIYIVSPIDLLPFNPLDDIVVAIIAFAIAFSDIGDNELGKLEKAVSLKGMFGR